MERRNGWDDCFLEDDDPRRWVMIDRVEVENSERGTIVMRPQQPESLSWIYKIRRLLFG
jgi:hypothetical protein